jgi:hypothetical protein
LQWQTCVYNVLIIDNVEHVRCLTAEKVGLGKQKCFIKAAKCKQGSILKYKFCTYWLTNCQQRKRNKRLFIYMANIYLLEIVSVKQKYNVCKKY